MFETDEDYNENENHDEYSDSGESDIAVIGMACRFPGAKDVNGFWENLKNGVESVSFFTEEELETAGIGREAFENPNFIKTRGGMLEEHQCFDASFFGYSPREAQVMDPQVRVFHECCWGALEDAGYDPMTYEGLTGLYAGAASNAYWQVITHFSSQTDDLGGLLSNYLNNRDFMCTNIAYRLNLKGPAVMVQTACSTALVAIHMATQALLNGECDMALAGGVSILDSPAPGYVFSEGSILSNDGHCRSFDAKAKGTVTGSGAGVMVLKSMEEALKDRDHIYAVIKATAINNDGVRKVGYTAPSPEGQSEVINVVHQMAEVEPESIGYVETHGSATFLGDSIEIEALKLAFNTERKGFCSLGAVKTNFGHLNTAAGAAGFIKTVLAIFHRQLPPTLHYETPNPRLDLKNSPFYVNTRLKKWEHNGSPLRAGVSSFGIGGTNAHLLLEEAPELDYQPETSQPRLYQLLLLSAKTGPALERLTQRLADHLKANPSIHLPDVAYTLQTGRGHFTHRRMLVSPDTEEAVRLLSSPDSRKVRSAFSTVENPPVIFMFSGLGSEYVNMGADLYQWEPAFAEEMDRCFGILSEAAGVDFKKALYPGGDGGEIEIPDEAVQPLMFSFQYALARMLMKWGIKPRAMTGYSFGEYIAACIAGVFSLEDALKLVIARARLVRKAPEGMMLSVPVTKEEVIPLLKGNKKLSLAIDNGPSCIVAGVTEAVEAFETQMKEKRMMSMRLSNRHALHSVMMEPVLKEFEELVGQFDLKKPQIPYVSNVTGHWIAANDAVSPAYWARHLGETVYFADGIRQLLGEKNAIFIEIGPGRDLTALMSRYVTEDSGQKVLNLIRPRDRDISDVYYLLNKIGHLWLYRETIDWNRFHAHREHARVPLPTYPFERHIFPTPVPPFNIGAVLAGQTGEGADVSETVVQDPGPSSSANLHQRPQLMSDFVPPSTPIQERVAHIIGNLFGFEGIGIHDDFFELGGDSLKAMTVAGKIHQALQVEIPMPEFFKRPTVGQLADYILNTGETGTYSEVEAVEQKEYYPASAAQKRLYILQQMEPGLTNYNLPTMVIFEGQLDAPAIESTFQGLIRRHESLRTSFQLVNDQAIQRVHDQAAFRVQWYDGGNRDHQEIISGFVRAFELSSAPLLRAGLIKLEEDRHVVMLDMHHIISDGTSLTIFFKEFMDLYTGGELEPLDIHYKDYSGWQAHEREIGSLRRQEEYWVNQLAGELPALNLPADFPRPMVQSFEGKRDMFQLGPEISMGLKNLSRDRGVTLFMLTLAMFNVLFAKLSGQEDIILGTPTAGRRHADFNRIIGIFINTLVMRNYPAHDKPFDSFLQEVKETTLNAFENQDCQFEDLVENDGMEIKRDAGRNPLFDVMIIFQNVQMPTIEMPQLTLKPYGESQDVSKFDMTIELAEGGDELYIRIEYCTRIFRKETIQRFVGYYKNIASSVIDAPGQPISDIRMIPEEEKNRLLYEFNDTTREYSAEKTIHQLVEEQAERTPNGTALVAKNPDASGNSTPLVHLTYAELNRQAHGLASRLKKEGVSSNTIVGIMVERSLEMIIGILGILKAGGAYLPVDTGFPEKRIDFMLKDSGTKIIVSNGLEFKRLDGFSQPTNKPPNLAYVIYTSGSTGRPKGVMLRHREVHNFITGITDIIAFPAAKSILALTTISFDIFVLETLLPLSHGLKVVVANEDQQQDSQLLSQLILDQGIDLLQATPSRMQLLIQGSGGDSLSCLQRLDTIMIGGEAFPLQLLETLKPLTSARIYNMYGPTETTVWSTVAELTNTNDITVGRPIANTSIYILDSHLNPQPVNVAGDLWIGGDGLAAGYLNRPEMTNDRFQTVKTKLYNTGDMARWLPDGNIEFIGRIDNQVKIRGFRVELGEIESQLLTHPEIDAAVVTTIGDALAAYIVSSRQMELPELRDHITQQLPDYMVPQYFVPIDSIPITPQGKLDRRALPTPEIKAGEDYIAPSGHEEETLVEIWSEVLDIDKSAIGVDANFFDLGGHSLRATVVLSRVHKALEINVPLGEMFKTPTIKGLVNYIKQAGKETFISIPIAEKKEYFPLSPAQKRMYMLQQMEPDSKSYNMPLAVFLEGDTGKEKLEAVLLRLIRRHESFRTSFIVTDGMQVMQKIHDMEDVDFEVEIHHLEPTDSDREDKAVNDTFPNSRTDNVIQRFMRPFDLARSPLIRVGLVQLKDRHFLLMLDNHHIISDGTSFGLFIGEFMQLYAGKELPHLRIQYKDYSQWKNSEEGRKSNQSQETFWLSQWQGDIPVVNLPSDFPRPDMQSIAGSTFNFFIESGDHTRLKEVANSEGSSMFVLLLSIFNILINKMTGLDDIPVGTQIAGRRHSDLENIIGLFLNTLVLKNKLDNEDTFTGYLEQMTESTLKNFENQEYQFEDLSEKILGTRKVNRNPLFDVMFIWQNMEMNAMDVPELTLTPYGGGLKSSSLIDLSLYGFDRGEFIFFYFEYSTALFKEETIQRFATYFKDIVSAVVTDEKTLLKDIKISHDLGNIKTDLSDEMEDDFDF